MAILKSVINVQMDQIFRARRTQNSNVELNASIVYSCHSLRLMRYYFFVMCIIDLPVEAMVFVSTEVAVI